MLEQIKVTLNSTRFWSLVLGAFVVYLKMKNWIGVPEMTMIETVLGGYIIINTSSKYEQK